MTTMTKKLTMRKQQKIISQILILQIWQIWNHLNMQICLLTKRLTIFCKEVLFTILIVMIHLFMIWIDSKMKLRSRMNWSIHQTIRWWSKNTKRCSSLIASTKRIEECSSTISFMCHLLTLSWCS
jgi:hypothetical protein